MHVIGDPGVTYGAVGYAAVGWGLLRTIRNSDRVATGRIARACGVRTGSGGREREVLSTPVTGVTNPVSLPYPSSWAP